MGVIASKFRKKKTTFEILETIDTEIKSIEELRRNTELAKKKIVGRFVIISIGLYVLTAFLFYFYYFPANFYDQLFYIIPLLLAPIIIILVKHFLTWYYQKKISSKQNKLVTLRNEKKDILEKVMETETYKVAKSILDKFAPPDPIRKLPETPLRPIKPMAMATGTVNASVRQRAIPPKPLALPTPVMPLPVAQPMSVNTKMATQSVASNLPPTLQMPRAILPRERSVFDKMLDYLVGDGPSNRYALICNKCYSHNGMAYRDEVDYISFRCCYCYTFNPAVKKRPVAPKFEYKLQSMQDSDSESEKNSPEDSSETDDGVVVLKSAQEIEESQHTNPSIEEETKTVNNEAIKTEVQPVQEESEHPNPTIEEEVKIVDDNEAIRTEVQPVQEEPRDMEQAVSDNSETKD